MKVSANFFDRRQLSLPAFHAVDADENAFNRRVQRLENGHDLADRRPGRNYVFDNHDFVVWSGFIADERAALAMILFFLPIEAVVQRGLVAVLERDRGSDRQRDSLIRRTE